jgi:hypothetical protein
MRRLGLVCVVLAACTTVEMSTVEQEVGGPCPPWGCANSPEVMHYGMHEANLFGKRDHNGLSLQRGGPNKRAQIWSAAGVPYDLYIEKNRFIGVSHDGQSTLHGQALLLAELHVVRKGQPFYNITIRRVREIKFLVGKPDPIEVYSLTWHYPGTGLNASKGVCNGPPSSQTRKDRGEMLDMLHDETLIFAGDRIDSTAMTLNRDPDFDWFNFGCAGHTLAKLHLTRNTITSQPEDDWAGRQATLKMLVGDYCGNGTPITESGTPLRWQSELMPYFPTPGSIEARWDEFGAKCLSKPRLGESSPNFPDVWGAIEAACTTLPPTCDNTNVYDFAGYRRVSAIPQ